MNKKMFNSTKIIALLLSISFCVKAQVRVNDPKKTAERSVEGRVNSKIDQGINRGLDKVEEGIGNIFKKKNKKDNKQSEESKTGSEENTKNNSSKEATEQEQGRQTTKSTPPATNTPKADEPKSLKVYSKFDFVPGEKVIALDDFSTTSVGDFPLGWNTNSSAEIVTLNDSPTKWLSMTKDGFYQPEFIKDIPENFTLEFDVFTRYRSSSILGYSFIIHNSDNPRRDISLDHFSKASFQFEWGGCLANAGYVAREDEVEIGRNDGLMVKKLICADNDVEYGVPAVVRFSIWRQKNRIRIYVNEEKILDVPQAFSPKYPYNVFKFGATYMNGADRENKDEFMISNIRYAVGAPDTRSKLITEGKFSTTGILFDVNSDKIKPESYGVLKDLGNVMKENATVKVRIIGHTDSDGDAAKNLDLSKRRAASVKNALATEFGIDAARMETDGKGQTQPAAANTTPEGKANNRRVEFIKL